MVTNHVDDTSYTTPHQEPFPKYVEIEYDMKHVWVLTNKHQSFPGSNYDSSAMASPSCQSPFDPYDLSSDDEEYLIPNNGTEMSPGQSNHAAR
jgi:hypothetical protein